MTARRLGRMIKALREQKGLSQRALAKKIKVSNVYIALLETGQRKNPSLAILERLAKAFKVPVDHLLR